MPVEPRIIRLTIALIAIVMPQQAKRLIYTKAFGWELDPSARVGISLLIAPFVRIGPKAVIGHFNIIKGSGTIELGESSVIGSLNIINGCEFIEMKHHAIVGYGNHISGPPLSSGLFPNSANRRPEFRLGEHATLVRSHRVECSDRVTIGRFTTIAGTQTEILTHGIDIQANVQRTSAVDIGEYCYIGSRVVIQSGATIPARCVVAPGAVVHGSPGSSEQLLGGVPAKTIKSLAGAMYFERDQGRVD